MSSASMAGALAAILMSVGVTDVVRLLRARHRRDGRLERLLAAVRRVAPERLQGRELSRLVAAAGLRDSVSGADVMALKVVAATGVAAATVLGVVLTGDRRLAVAGLVLAVAAFTGPDIVLRNRIERRRRRLALELPGVLDLLAVAVGAGLPTTEALEVVGRRHPGLLGNALQRACIRIALGEPRRSALRDVAARCPHAGVAATVAALEQSERHGVPLVPALARIAEDARGSRARAIQEHAARAGPKIQLVIALGLVPATMLFVAAGLVSAFD